MSEQQGAGGTGRRRLPGRRRYRPSARSVGLVLLVATLVVGGFAAWISVTGLGARRDLDAAAAGTTSLRTAIVDGRTADATAQVELIRRHAARARRATSGPLWRLAGRLPVVGTDARAVTTTTASVDDVAQSVLPVLAAQASAVSPSSVRVSGARLDLGPVAAAAAPLAAAQRVASAAAARADAIQVDALTSPALAHAVVRAQDGLDAVASLTTNASDAARLMPAMLGADGRRRYFLGFQTDAEARATGGLLGAYGVLEADHGRLRVVTLGPRTDLDPGNLSAPAVDLGADYRSTYGDDPGWWVNTNLSPHFPYAARLWLAMYHRQGGPALDGAVATDPVALGYLLGATGPTRLADGTEVTSANAARLTMSTVYRRIPNDDRRRDAYLQSVARAVVARVLSGAGSSRDVAHALGHAAGQGRLLVYSAHPDEEAVLAGTALGGSAAATPGPYVGVYLNNGSGSKLDYYMRAAVDYRLGACTAGSTQAARVTLTLANTAPASGLPPYVTTRLDRRGVTVRSGPGDGTNVDLMALHLPAGALVTAARLDGAPLALSPHDELGRPVVTFPVATGPGREHVVVLDLDEPHSPLAPRVRVQPMAVPAVATVSARTCR